MSLFDVIKYSGTDLEELSGLKSLPPDLFKLYFSEWILSDHVSCSDNMRYKWALVWAIIKPDEARKKFLYALRNYNNELI